VEDSRLVVAGMAFADLGQSLLVGLGKVRVAARLLVEDSQGADVISFACGLRTGGQRQVDGL
jgi:hypothetical protein